MKKLFVLILSIAFMTACNKPETKENHDVEIQEHSHDTDHQDHEHSDEVENDEHSDKTELKLNGDKKWAINKEMLPFLNEADKLVAGYIKNKNTDYKKLALSLEEKNSELIKSCTMTGDSHDALHLWLEPHLELVEELKTAEDTEKANEIITKLENSFKTFHQFFE